MLNLQWQSKSVVSAVALALIVTWTSFSLAQKGKERPASDDPAPAAGDRVYVGTVKELSGDGKPNPQLGIVIEGDDVLAYACSKNNEFNQAHSRWMKGKIGKDGSFEALGDGVKLAGTLRGDTAQLIWTVGGREMSVDATLVKAGSRAGLYQTECTIDDDDYIAGWVVGIEGDVTGALLNRRNKQIDPATGEVAGSRAQARQAARQVKLAKIAFQRKPDRKFLLTFTNFGDTPSQNRTFSIRILKQENLNAQLGVLQPGETKTVTVQIERAKLLRVIAAKLKQLGQGLADRIKNRERLVEVQVDVEVEIDGTTTAQTVTVGDENAG